MNQQNSRNQVRFPPSCLMMWGSCYREGPGPLKPGLGCNEGQFISWPEAGTTVQGQEEPKPVRGLKVIKITAFKEVQAIQVCLSSRHSGSSLMEPGGVFRVISSAEHSRPHDASRVRGSEEAEERIRGLRPEPCGTPHKRGAQGL